MDWHALFSKLHVIVEIRNDTHFMSNVYRVSYTTDGLAHHKHYTALNEETAISMFLAGAAHKHTDVDRDNITVQRVDVDQTSECCGGSCGCDHSQHDRRYE